MSYFGFQSDQTLAEGTLAMSAAQRQFSRVSGWDDNRWSVDGDGGIQTSYANGKQIGSGPANGQCQGNTLLFDYGQYDKQQPPLSTALQEAWDGGGWNAVHY